MIMTIYDYDNMMIMIISHIIIVDIDYLLAVINIVCANIFVYPAFNKIRLCLLCFISKILMEESIMYLIR